MLDKLGAIEERFYYLEERLSDPSVLSDQEEYKKVSKEYKNIEEIVQVSKQYKEVLGNITTAKEMLGEQDPDMKAMAKEELQELEPQKTELEEKLKIILWWEEVLEKQFGVNNLDVTQYGWWSHIFRVYDQFKLVVN